MKKVLIETNMPGIKFSRRGKVRDVYEFALGIIVYLLVVTTDRLSAFDVVLPDGIPGKGEVLNKISLFWFEKLKDVIDNHVLTADVSQYQKECMGYSEQLDGRSMLVVKAKPMPVECIVRGYLSGSGWKEYKKSGTVCGIRLPEGLVESDKIPGGPIFTPSTKEEEGHDINISFERMIEIVGKKRAEELRDASITLYKAGAEHAESKGIIIADTKFEFGLYNGELILIDEILTPDSSRFWSMKTYQSGRAQDSYDKQIVRDYLLTLDWDQTAPGPRLPEDIAQKAAARYQEIYEIITG
ncbi:MAG: phosphoribosylaminoimidazolesuccinocarboxamide synthase [Parcubacteria group bacterium]|jgi:phosphoribosylaminoimidazole-succinocarboxamide synthase